MAEGNSSAVVVIATYNEAGTIAQVLRGLFGYNVVMVDDNSTDGTADIAARFHATLIRRSTKTNLASVYLCGFNEALRQYDPQWIVQMDAGMTHHPKDVPRLLLAARRSQAPLVIGSRFMKRPRLRSWRTVVSLGAAWLMRRLGVDVKDATSGFRCWDARLLRLILDALLEAQGHAFQLETLWWAWQVSGGNVKEVPIEYRLTNSTFNARALLEGLCTYWKIVRYTIGAKEGRQWNIHS